MNVRKHSLLFVSLACLGAGAADPQTKIGEYWPTVAPVVVPVQPAAVRVLFLESTANRGSYSKNQLAILSSTIIRDYMREHGAKRPDGSPEFLVLDAAADVSKLPPEWQKVVNDNKALPLPSYTASNGKRGEHGVIPDVPVEEFLSILKKYGG